MTRQLKTSLTPSSPFARGNKPRACDLGRVTRQPKTLLLAVLFTACFLVHARAQECLSAWGCCASKHEQLRLTPPLLRAECLPDVRTCVFSEAVTITGSDSVSFGNGSITSDTFNTRLLTHTEGSCIGAVLDPATHRVTLQPGTYFVEANAPFQGTYKQAARISVVDSETGQYMETVALGNIGYSRPLWDTQQPNGFPRVNENTMSTTQKHVLSVSTPIAIEVQHFLFQPAATPSGPFSPTFGYANVVDDLSGYGDETTQYGARLSVRRVTDSHANSTCVFRDQVSTHTSSGGRIKDQPWWYSQFRRELVDVSGVPHVEGDSSTNCGASLHSLTNFPHVLTLQPGSYLVQGRVTGVWSLHFSASLREVIDASAQTTQLIVMGSAGSAGSDIQTNSAFLATEITVTGSASSFALFDQRRSDNVESWGYGMNMLDTSYHDKESGGALGASVTVRKLQPDEIGKSCLFYEKASVGDAGFGGPSTDATWTNRRLTNVSGDPSTCGSELDASSDIVTLRGPGVYVVEAIVPGFRANHFSARLVAIDENGVATRTVARSNAGYSQADVGNANVFVYVPPTEVTVSKATKSFRLEQYNRRAHSQGFGQIKATTAANVEYVVGAQLRVERVV